MNTKMRVIPKSMKIIIQNYLTLGMSSTKGYRNCINLDSAVIHSIDSVVGNNNYFLSLMRRTLQNISYAQILKFRMNVTEKKNLKNIQSIKKKQWLQGRTLQKSSITITTKLTSKLLQTLSTVSCNMRNTTVVTISLAMTLIREFVYIQSVQVTTILLLAQNKVATSSFISNINKSEEYDD